MDKKIVRYAKEHFPGIVIIKLSTVGFMGTSGWPDRLFIWKGKMLFMEMKSPTGRPTDLQYARIEELRKQGMKVFVVHYASNGIEILGHEFGGVKRKSYTLITRYQ